MENQRWKFSPIPKIFIHYSKKNQLSKIKEFSLLLKNQPQNCVVVLVAAEIAWEDLGEFTANFQGK